MKTCIILAVAAAAVACTSTAGPPAPARAKELRGAGALSPPAERTIRYYLDDAGTIWDDRGKRHQIAPSFR